VLKTLLGRWIAAFSLLWMSSTGRSRRAAASASFPADEKAVRYAREVLVRYPDDLRLERLATDLLVAADESPPLDEPREPDGPAASAATALHKRLSTFDADRSGSSTSGSTGSAPYTGESFPRRWLTALRTTEMSSSSTPRRAVGVRWTASEYPRSPSSRSWSAAPNGCSGSPPDNPRREPWQGSRTSCRRDRAFRSCRRKWRRSAPPARAARSPTPTLFVRPRSTRSCMGSCSRQPTRILVTSARSFGGRFCSVRMCASLPPTLMLPSGTPLQRRPGRPLERIGGRVDQGRRMGASPFALS
jgi:hypothetical protein